VKQEETMSGRENEQVNPKRTERDEVEVESNPIASEQQQAITSDVDDILDEIDATLEENAAAFVAAFVQKGGQ
jgi:prokaryotic ubiquitin-like protein Pup